MSFWEKHKRWSRFLPAGGRAILVMLLACALLLVLVLPGFAWDRAGGGGGYSGGSYSGGGGGGGGGDGGGDILFLLIWLCFKHPVIGIPLLILFVVFTVVTSQKGNQARKGQVIRRGALALGEQRRQEAVGRLKSEDPQFDEQRFCDRVDQAFHKIQAAWSQQDLTSVRAFISDGIHERFSLQALEQRQFGYRPQVDNVVVRKMLLAQVFQDPFFDVVTLRIEASCSAYRVSLQDGRFLSGSRTPESFAEYWSFLRRRGVQSKDTPGLIEGTCPNCGAEIAMNQHARCSSCDSMLRSGQYDWVLCEITQECEWVESPPDRLPGVAHYRASRDKGFNIQHLEDLASVVFWRKVMADRLGDAAPLRKVAIAEFVEDYARQFDGPASQKASQKASEPAYWGDCSVGSVETRGVLAGTPLDQVLVEIRWSGTRFLRTPAGPPRRTQHGSAFRHLFVFVRKAGVVTEVGQSVSSSHCPLCGAPETDLTSNACEFCGEVLNDGAHDWNLARILTSAAEEAQQLIRQANAQGAQVSAGFAQGVLAETGSPQHTPQGTELLSWAIKMALSDHELDRRERAMIERVARYRHVPSEHVETLIEAAKRGELAAPRPENAEQARHWLAAMADISLADGQLHADEMRLLAQVGAQLKMSVYDVKALLKQRRAELYRAARARLQRGSGG